MVLLAGPAANRFIKLEHVTPNILAQANSDARRVYVFWERVGPAVNRQAVAHGDALGVVIAHELGHVLMPARSHSQTGIMQDNYNVYLSYGLQFTVESFNVQWGVWSTPLPSPTPFPQVTFVFDLPSRQWVTGTPGPSVTTEPLRSPSPLATGTP